LSPAWALPEHDKSAFWVPLLPSAAWKHRVPPYLLISFSPSLRQTWPFRTSQKPVWGKLGHAKTKIPEHPAQRTHAQNHDNALWVNELARTLHCQFRGWIAYCGCPSGVDGGNHYSRRGEDRETAQRNSLKTGTAGNQIEPAGGNVAKHSETLAAIRSFAVIYEVYEGPKIVPIFGGSRRL
jgi:hypothetical protein